MTDKEKRLVFSDITYRKISNDDLDLLYNCPEVNDALVPLRGNRELAEELVESEWSVAVNNDTGELMFCIGQMWSYSELSPRYLYFYKNKMCTFINVFHEFHTVSIFYCSDLLDLNYMKKYFNFVLSNSDEFLRCKDDNHGVELNFKFIESKELFRDYV